MNNYECIPLQKEFNREIDITVSKRALSTWDVIFRPTNISRNTIVTSLSMRSEGICYNFICIYSFES